MADTDNKLALPVRTESDIDNYVLIKIRGNPTGTGPSTNEAIVDNDKNVHIEVHGNKPSGADVVLRLSEMGAVNPDGKYDASLNTKPASIGLVIHDRHMSPGEAQQNFRPTGIASSVDTNVKALDVAIRDGFGNPFTDANPLPVVLINLDGFRLTTPDSVQATGSEDGTKTGTKHSLRVDSTLDLRVGISSGANKASVDGSGKLSVKDIDTKASVDSVLAQLQSGGVILGTDNGLISGVARPFVNNRRLQILSALDRQQAITTADFGTKDQRITQIDYTAPSIGAGPGYTARKVISYTLVGTRYRRDSINWVLI